MPARFWGLMFAGGWFRRFVVFCQRSLPLQFYPLSFYSRNRLSAPLDAHSLRSIYDRAADTRRRLETDTAAETRQKPAPACPNLSLTHLRTETSGLPSTARQCH